VGAGRYRSVLLPESESLLMFFGPDLALSRSSSFESTDGSEGRSTGPRSDTVK